jgi:hypothetical protein
MAYTIPRADMAAIVEALAIGAENCGFDPDCLYAAPLCRIYELAIGYDPLREGWSLQETCANLAEYFQA